MKPYILKLLLFLCFYFGIIFLVYVQPYKADNFWHSVADKHERLEKEIPQIIFVGGSNTLFGIDSKMVIDSMNYDVVNMGIHMGLGYYYQTQEMIGAIRKDDIVVLIPEYVNVFEDKTPNERMLNQLTEHYPKSILIFDRQNRWKMFYRHILDKLKKNISHIQKGSKYDLGGQGGYSLSGVNEYGDQTDHLTVRKGVELGQWNMNKYKDTDIHATFIEQTQAVINKCEEEGCHVYISFPSLALSAYDEGVANAYLMKIDEFGFQRLGTPKEFVFENIEFYDTFYHPLKKARRLRTIRLIAELKKKIAQSLTLNESSYN